MAERCVLFLTQHHLTVCRAGRGEVRQEQTFTVDEQGQADFRAWLEKNRHFLFQWLVDLPDEDFHQEVLPHVTGTDRKALLARKLTQHFFGTPYTLVRSLGREKQGRRDEHFLFTALTRPQALEPWLQPMHELEAPIAGIYTPALLLSSVLNRATAAEPRLILTTLGSGGLRQSYFEHGQLRFSRLKLLNTTDIEEAAVNTYGEAVRIYQYLVGQRLLTRGTQVPVLCLASPAHFELLRQACSDTHELTFSFSDLTAVVRAKQLRVVPAESSVDALLAYLLIKQAPSEQLGDIEVRRDYRRWQWLNLFNKSTWGALVLACLFSVVALASIWSNREKSAEADIAAQQAKLRYDNIVRGLPAIPISPTQLRSLIEQWQRLQSHSPTLVSSLEPISEALQQFPQVELKSLNWRLANTPEDAATSPGADTWLIIDIDAQLPAATNADRRIQVEKIDRFVAALIRSPDDNARVVQRPFDTDPSKSLKGSSEVSADREPISFSIRYWRKTDA